MATDRDSKTDQGNPLSVNLAEFDQFNAHIVRRVEKDLAGASALHDVDVMVDAVVLQTRAGGVEIIDLKGEMNHAIDAALGNVRLLPRSFGLEDVEA